MACPRLRCLLVQAEADAFAQELFAGVLEWEAATGTVPGRNESKMERLARMLFSEGDPDDDDDGDDDDERADE